MKLVSIMLIVFTALFFGSCDLLPSKDAPLRPLPPLELPNEELPSTENLPFFVSGTYAGGEEAAFCTVCDTLSISKEKDKVNVYHIIRKTKFRRNVSDQDFKPEYYQNAWYGSYDETNKIMYPIDAGKGYSLQFNTEDAVLALDSTEYKKIE